MELKQELVGQVTLIEVTGRIDSANAPVLQDRLGALIAGGTASMLLDMANVEYISSAGFRSLLILAKQANQSKARFALCSLSPKVRRLFDLGGFLDLLPI